MLRLELLFGLLLVGCSAEVRLAPGEQDETCSDACDDSEETTISGASSNAGGILGQCGAGGSWSGAGGSDGAGGFPTPPPDCAAHELPVLPEWQPSDPPSTSGAAQIAAAREAIVGDWHGVVTTPWWEPYEVVATFRPDGGYSAQCVYGSDYDGQHETTWCCVAFNYGSDRDSDLKQWRLENIDAGGIGGEIDIVFGCNSNIDCYLPNWQGLIESLAFDATGNRLRFEFWHEGYGPVSFDLERVL